MPHPLTYKTLAYSLDLKRPYLFVCLFVYLFLIYLCHLEQSLQKTGTYLSFSLLPLQHLE